MNAKLLLACAALLALPAAVRAQEMEARYEKKLQNAFIKNAAWVTDYDAAKKQAKESGKLVFAYFTRSYAP